MAFHLASFRDETEGRTLAAPAYGPPAFGFVLVGAALLAAWAACYVAGGSKSAAPHLFYVPIIVAAVRFRRRGALVAALLAGALSGPLLPLDVQEGTAQPAGNWITRTVLFVVIGQLTAYLHRHSLPSLAVEVSARRVRRELRDALAGGQVGLAYQPIVDLDDGGVVGAEALVRYEHPQRGPRPTDEFVRSVERAGCIEVLTRFVLAEACEQVAGWRRTVLRGRASFTVAVNVSASDLTGERIVGDVAEALGASGLPASWLHLEITETALVEDVEAASQNMAALRALGVRLAIDDFGTGESSLGYLDRFPVDVLKIDRVFVRRLSADAGDDALTHGIIAMAQAMDLDVVAEGVETETQAEAVRRFGCRRAQGYLFSPPVDAGDLEALLSGRRSVPVGAREAGSPGQEVAPDQGVPSGYPPWDSNPEPAD